MMSGTSPRFLKAIPILFLLLTALVCSAFAEDIQTLIEKAEGGDPETQFYLGRRYHKGQGVPQDNVEGAKWSRKAAEHGHASAQYNLGIAYGKGQGVPQDHAEEMKWFKKVAEQAIFESQYNLGVAYRKGKGVSQDYVQSYFWLSLAASRNYGEFFKKYSGARGLVASMLTPEQLMEAQRVTREWEAKHPRE